MPLRNSIPLICFITLAHLACANASDYFILPSAPESSDANPGDFPHPWKTLEAANSHVFKPGDTLQLEGGALFTGFLVLDQEDSGNESMPVIVTSTTSTAAVISSGSHPGIELRGTRYVALSHLKLLGAGRKSGSQSDGFRAVGSSHLHLDGLEVSGFQHNGVVFIDCSHVRALRLLSHDNGNAGIQTYGTNWNDPTQYGEDFYFGYCRTDNNPGDPTVLLNHSGNGLLLGQVNGALIEYCEASNNGWDMPNQNDNGPAGIWAWQSDNVIIQHCISHDNKTTAGKGDGDGFDFDGGVRHSTIRYCLAYGNQGPGYLLFQGSWATSWSDNAVHHCVSVNDGHPNGKSGLLVWHEGGEMNGAAVHHNTFWNTMDSGSAIWFAHALPGGRFAENVFVTSGPSLLGVSKSASALLGNRYWRPDGIFLCDGISSLADWAQLYSQETYSGGLAGSFGDPGLLAPLSFVGLDEPARLPFWLPFSPLSESTCLATSRSYSSLLGIDTVGTDIAGNDANTAHLGAYASTVSHDRRLLNVSTRAWLGRGTQAVIGGFVIQGDRPKKVLLRAVGPALDAFLPGQTLASSPTLELHHSTASGDEVLRTSEIWNSTADSIARFGEAFALCGAFGWPRTSDDSALEAELVPGNYTAVMNPGAGTTGLALVEIYEEGTSSANNRLVNLSTRSWVGSGADAQIAGFVISGSEPQGVLIRAAGPALQAFLANDLLVTNPALSVTRTSPDSGGESWNNDDWSAFPNDAESIEQAASAVGAFKFPRGSKDAALLITLPPGSYTASVTPGNESAGIGLIEVYQLP